MAKVILINDGAKLIEKYRPQFEKDPEHKYGIIRCQGDPFPISKEIRNDLATAIITEDEYMQVQAFAKNIPEFCKDKTLYFKEIDKTINLSNPALLDSILIAAGCYAEENNLQISDIDLSNNPSISSCNFFYSLEKIFKTVSKIDLTGTHANIGKIPKFAKEKYVILSHGKKVQESESRPEQAHESYASNGAEEEEIGEPPDLVRHDDITDLTLFKPVALKANGFPTNLFIADFLDTLWSKLLVADKFYAFNAVFSMSVDHVRGHSIMKYDEFSNNYLFDQVLKANGRTEIIDLQQHVFPRGFIAYPTNVDNVVLYDGLYCVVIKGAFLGVNAKVYGFNRTLIIKENFHGYEISNDHLFICLAKL